MHVLSKHTRWMHGEKKKFDFLLLFSSGNRVKSHCTVESSTSCLPCMTGTYTDQPNGLERCHHCTNCDSGTFMFISSFPDTESDLNRVILLLIVVNLKSNQDIKGCLCSLIQIFNMMIVITIKGVFQSRKHESQTHETCWVRSFYVGRFWSQNKDTVYSNIRCTLWTYGGILLCPPYRTQLWESTGTQTL